MGRDAIMPLKIVQMQGFRRYQSIRQTLCHELAHIVFSEHDSNFKQLNSQLCKECEQLSSSLGVRMFQTAAEGWQLDVSPQPFDVMGLTAASSGRTLRHLAGDAQLPAAGQLPKNFTWSPEVRPWNTQVCSLRSSLPVTLSMSFASLQFVYACWQSMSFVYCFWQSMSYNSCTGGRAAGVGNASH